MFALTNAEIETVTRGRLARGTVLVDKGRIAAVGRSVRVPKRATVHDMEGRLVTPGLIEAHSHAGLVEDGLTHDPDVNEGTDPATPHLLAIDAFKPSDVSLVEAAAAGVTTMYLTQGSLNVFGGIGAVVKTWAPSFDEQIMVPAAGMKMALGENPKKAYGAKSGPGTRMGIAALMRKVFTEAQHYAERKRRHAASRKKDRDPFALDLKHEAVSRLLSGAFPARCHAHRSVDMLTFMRIADEFGFAYCFEHATEAADILEPLKRRKVPLIIGPSFGKRSKLELRAKGFATVARAVEAGLTVAVTSDHGVTPMKYLTVYLALAVREGLPAERALELVTINAARILGVERRLGSIEAGKDADLVVWDADPLDVRRAPFRVYIAGRPFDAGDRNTAPDGRCDG